MNAKLYERELTRRDAENAEVQARKSAIDLGSEIRNDVMDPCGLVKDIHTSTERIDVVLDVNVDSFIEFDVFAAVGSTLRQGGHVVEQDDATREVINVFRAQSLIISSLQRFLDERGFVEVEPRTMHSNVVKQLQDLSRHTATRST